MNTPIKVILLVAVSVILVSSGYTILFTGQTTKTNTSENNDTEKPEPSDTLAPSITASTGDTMADAGTPVTITTTFSDNVAVTSAKLYYKPATALAWSSKSILSGSAILPLPADSNESWYYYIQIDDAAGNGPIGDPSTDGSSYYTIVVMNEPMNPPDDNDTNGNNGNNTQNYSRFVFIELGTKIVCSECPKISIILNELYNIGELSFLLRQFAAG